MPLSGCTNGLVATALLALLLLPTQYLVPEAGREEALEAGLPATPQQSQAWIDLYSFQFPPLDLYLTVALIALVFCTYLFEWIQRKIMEKRMTKLNQYLGASLKQLRAWDSRQEQLDASLRMVQNANVEYNLLLYLLLRQHSCISSATPPADCCFDKDLDNFPILRKPPMDAQPV